MTVVSNSSGSTAIGMKLEVRMCEVPYVYLPCTHLCCICRFVFCVIFWKIAYMIRQRLPISTQGLRRLHTSNMFSSSVELNTCVCAFSSLLSFPHLHSKFLIPSLFSPSFSLYSPIFFLSTILLATTISEPNPVLSPTSSFLRSNNRRSLRWL